MSQTAITPTTAVQVNVNQSVNQSFAAHSLGIASLALGAISFLVCWIPFIGIPLSGLGLLMGCTGGVLSLTRKGSGIGYAIAGSAVSGSGLLMSLIFMTAVSGFLKAVDEVSNEPVAQAQPSSQAIPTEDGPPNIASANVPEGTKPIENPLLTKHSPATLRTEWHDAQQPLTLGDIEIRITKVAHGHVPLVQNIGNDDGRSEDVLLAIWLEIRNISERKKIDYIGWSADHASLLDIDAELTDDSDNTYRKIRWDFGLEVKDANSQDSIYPGKRLNDAIVFQEPVEGVKFLRLRLSGKACKEEGEFKFQIPAEMIEKSN